MMEINDLDRNFQGFLHTPVLWSNSQVFGMEQYVPKTPLAPFNLEITPDLFRLGKLVERFVCHQLEADAEITILDENLQIHDAKKTIGELDVILRSGSSIIHLEIVYKFYLYDPTLATDEFSAWIGPNKQDHLLYKVNKLKEKQLPLLYHPPTRRALKDLDLNVDTILQRDLFKAQLFLPLEKHYNVFHQLNPACVKGFYIHRKSLEQFQFAEFFIPIKINWLMQVHTDVAWLDYSDFMVELDSRLMNQMAPLCWLKEGKTLRKFFVVWW